MSWLDTQWLIFTDTKQTSELQPNLNHLNLSKYLRCYFSKLSILYKKHFQSVSGYISAGSVQTSAHFSPGQTHHIFGVAEYDSSQKSLDRIAMDVQWESFMPPVLLGFDQKQKDFHDHLNLSFPVPVHNCNKKICRCGVTWTDVQRETWKATLGNTPPSGACFRVSQALISLPFSFLSLLYTFSILSIQVRSSVSIISTGPHHIRKNCEQEKKNTEWSQTSLITSQHVSTLWSQTWCRTDQLKISVSLSSL